MTKTYLFDWGDTLMVNFPDQSGKMCDWPIVEPIDGALETLEYLSKHYRVYIATNAADSSEQEIQQAFSRVGLDKFISGYFCKANLGVDKASPDFSPQLFLVSTCPLLASLWLAIHLRKISLLLLNLESMPFGLYRNQNKALTVFNVKALHNFRN